MWYRTGTITVTNGSTTVTGSGTAWIANAGVGEALYAPDGRLYEIAAIVSNTQLTLATNYLGSTQSGQAYVIVPSQSYIRDLAAQAADLLNNYSTVYSTVGQGKFPDGTVSVPAVRFTADDDTGFYRSASNEVTFVAGGVAQFKYNTSGISFTTAPTFTTPTIFNVNSASTAMRITQTGAGNALVVEDSANPDASPFVVDADGRVIVGNTTTVSTPNFGGSSVSAPVQIQSAGFYDGLSIQNYIAGNGASSLMLAHSRGGTLGTQVVVASGDYLGSVNFSGSDGTAFIRGATIDALVDGTPGTNDMPGRLVFSTTADGASSPTERMRIDNVGRVGIGSTAATSEGFRIAQSVSNSGGTAYAAVFYPTIPASSGTTNFEGVRSRPSISATNSLTDLKLFVASQGTLTGTATNQYGYFSDSSLIGATNNYGFHSNIASGTGRWNFYANGTANNYFAGTVLVGTTSEASFAAGTASNSNALRAGAIFVSRGSTDFRTHYEVYNPNGKVGAFGATGTSLVFATGSGDTERMRIDSGGLLTLASGSGLSIARTAVTAPAATDGNVFSGTYTPTLTNTTNVAASTAYECQYMRVGNVVTVSGLVAIDPTGAGSVELKVSLPIASNMTQDFHIGGTFSGTNSNGGAIYADAVNDVARFLFVPTDTANRIYAFNFTYRII